jgi:UDP-N-acetylglucosamine--N-acetylmuramyl-(pentapeptide) pyrophosphoryl-undecaprenol N-acetylglucosamine transferase
MKKILIATGGSGGHVIPSLSIYDALKDEFEVKISTDSRGSKFINNENYNYSLIDVPNLFSNLLLLPYNLIKFCISIIKSYKYLKLNNFNILISTGGYMSLPLCLASNLLNIKIYIFEPNLVLGRANKFMLNFAKKIICYDKNLKGISKKLSNKIYLVKPLLRKEIYKYQKNEKTTIAEKKKILIIGGSQGAKFFDEFITKIIIKLSKIEKIQVLQQVINLNSKENIKEFYQKNHIEHELFHFDDKLLMQAVNYDLAITRSGASTISELAYLNIPFVAIPYPYAKDNHQYYNAEFYEKNKSCWLIMQKDIDENNFTDLMIKIFQDQNEYSSKKNNLIKLNKENTWEKNKSKLIELINEN